mgnify:FL=1
MKLYTLSRIRGANYDEMASCAVVAASEIAARCEAAKAHCDEPATTWLNPKLSTCAEVKMETGVICQNIR